MASLTIYGLLLCVLLVNIQATNLQVGSSVNGTLLYSENVKLLSWPLKVRTKNVFYNDATNQRVIKGISAIDLDLGSKAKATVTSGGVGSTFVNIRLKSERGEGLNYQVQVFG